MIVYYIKNMHYKWMYIPIIVHDGLNYNIRDKRMNILLKIILNKKSSVNHVSTFPCWDCYYLWFTSIIYTYYAVFFLGTI